MDDEQNKMMISLHEISFLILCDSSPYREILKIGDEIEHVMRHVSEFTRHCVSVQTNDPNFVAQLLNEATADKITNS